MLGCQASVGPAGGNDFGHQCDSEAGSSGSPVLDLQHRVVGLHHLGGCSAGGRGENRAVSMARILPLFPPEETHLSLTAASVIPRSGSGSGRIAIRAVLSLGRSSDGADPLTEPVTLTLADADGPSFAATVPPGGFRRAGRSYLFSDPDGSSGLRTVRLAPRGIASLEVLATPTRPGRRRPRGGHPDRADRRDTGIWSGRLSRRAQRMIYP